MTLPRASVVLGLVGGWQRRLHGNPPEVDGGSGPKTRQTVAERRRRRLEVSMMGTCEGYTCYSQHNAPNKIMWSAWSQDGGRLGERARDARSIPGPSF